ncbi:MAG: nucleotide pyrophosphohydrolase [Candidatus Hydromicrobium sp.]
MSINKNKNLNLLISKILEFRRKRDWEKFHNPKNLTISISLEAAELLENFQWKNSEESIKSARENKEIISEEVADLLIYIFYLCNDLGIDFIDAIDKKIEKNNKKYPVNKSKGKSNKYNELK